MKRIFDNVAFSSFSLHPPLETLALSSRAVFCVATSVQRGRAERKA